MMPLSATQQGVALQHQGSDRRFKPPPTEKDLPYFQLTQERLRASFVGSLQEALTSIFEVPQCHAMDSLTQLMMAEVSTMANLVILTALTTPILESRVPVTVNVAPTVSLEMLQMLVVHF